MNGLLPDRKETEDVSPIKLTKTLMNQYRESLENRGCKQQTINMYFCYLNKLYAFLPDTKELTDENLKDWIDDLNRYGYSDRTMNLYLSSVNGLMRFCGHKNVPVSVTSTSQKALMPELTRDEYLRLLACAKKAGLDREYLLIQTLGSIDIELVSLDSLTVESCRKGALELPNHREVFIPDCLRKELLAYVKKHGPDTGSIFVSRNGHALDRSNITHSIEKLGKEAGIEYKKSNPSALHRLYRRTQEEIDQQLLPYHIQAYEELLENEQKVLNGNDH